ncbi:SGNH/GDSL hydrolase family protein [Heyndrickxia acidicola]|uniref:SGNH/GDSL hydrolase family protein n=1 Tax=Heyndrickxia acidicola TaxID=209389 RepID=A0ABU6MK86_9BACI|nr:SGNH/GDSL hydrolase family protein [Heyndrickxia acidicola]MED1204704.1 SGNH/GDSL hydrolase family protein [Heyndrickxia acidicola]
MKRFLTFLGIVLTVTILILGKAHWSKQTAVSAFASDKESVSATPAQTSKPSMTTDGDQQLLNQTKHWPKTAQEEFKKDIQAGLKFKVAIVGSTSIGSNTGGMAGKLKKALLAAYGNNHLDVQIFSYNTMSNHFLGEKLDQQVLTMKPDLVLWEPFILNDTGNLTDADMHKNILAFFHEVKAQNKKAVVLLQPAQPLYKATFYPQHVLALKNFAKEHHIPYLDHWKAWPAISSLKLKKDLTVDNQPNAKGNQIWFTYLKHYFIGA